MVLSDLDSKEPRTLKINLAGGFSLSSHSDPFIRLANRKACGVLAYLALREGRSDTRERLAGLFWSDRSEDQARASLRQCVKQLRTLFDKHGIEGLEAGRGEISLAAVDLEVDVVRYFQELESGQINDALKSNENLPERLLYGFETLDQSFASWLFIIRQHWHEKFSNRLNACFTGEVNEVEKSAAEALINIDATHEKAHRLLIRYHAETGNTPAALKQYKTLWDLLDRDYDMEPDDETLALIAQIKSGEMPKRNIVVETSQSQTVTTPLTIIGSKLPTISISQSWHGKSDGNENYLIDGFQRELIASLVRFREWVVLEDTSDPEVDLGQAKSIDPAADYLLTGTYYQYKDVTRLIINLKDVKTKQYVWSEAETLTLENWFEVQREIVRRNAIALNVYLSAERLSKIANQPDISIGVYDRWLRGQSLAFLWQPEVRERSEAIFRSIIEEAPDFSPAYSSLAQLRNSHHLVFPGAAQKEERIVEAKGLAELAVAKDPLDSRSHLCLAWSLAMNGETVRAEFYFKFALDLNENDPWTLVSAALGLAYLGRTDEAKTLADKALSLNLNPSGSHWGYQSGIRFMCGDYEGCLEAAEMADNRLGYLAGWRIAALGLFVEVQT
jgi:DNA-binding SARP family transcriptional activator